MLGAQLQARVDRRVHDDAAGERLVGVQQQLEPLAEAAGDLVPLHLGADDVRPAALALEADGRRCEIFRRQQRGGEAVLRGPARMKAFRHRAEHLAQADRLRRGQTQRPDHLLFAEPEQLAARCGGAEDAGGAGDVPAAIVVRGIDGVADPAFHFDAEDERVQEVAAGNRAAVRPARGSPAPPDRPDG